MDVKGWAPAPPPPSLPGTPIYSLGGVVPLGSQKSYPLLDQILQILWPYTRLKLLNCSWFQSFVSSPIKRDPMITRTYTRLNGLKTIPFPVTHTHIANIWEYQTPGLSSSLLLYM